MNPEQTCIKCRYSSPKERPNDLGCRRYPPHGYTIVVIKPLSVVAANARGEVPMGPVEEKRSIYPNVRPDWTCGEFAPELSTMQS